MSLLFPYCFFASLCFSRRWVTLFTFSTVTIVGGTILLHWTYWPSGVLVNTNYCGCECLVLFLPYRHANCLTKMEARNMVEKIRWRA